MRRAPKISVFLILGAALGVLVAMILTFAFNGTAEVSPNTGVEYTQGQVFGFLVLFWALRRAQAAPIAAMMYFQPVAGVLLARLFLGGRSADRSYSARC